jgi:hypothetical protein
MATMRHIGPAVWLLVLLPAALSARTWLVPSQCPIIQAGLDSAAFGDTVLVAPGIYTLVGEAGTGLSPGPGVSLISEAGPEVTVIEFCDIGTGIALAFCEGARVSGFTVTFRYWDGCQIPPTPTYGVWCWNCTDVIVEDCIIENVAFGIFVDGVSAEWWKPVFRNNVIRHCGFGIGLLNVSEPGRPLFEDNSIAECNYGAEIFDSSPIFQGNTISGCRDYGLYYDGACGGDCSRNVIAENLGVGVYIYADPPLAAPDFNGGLNPPDANDFYDNGSYDIKYDHSGGVNGVMAKLNYWGGDCPDFASKLYGNVYYSPWLDSTHTVFLNADDCPGTTDPSTWGGIKALFR